MSRDTQESFSADGHRHSLRSRQAPPAPVRASLRQLIMLCFALVFVVALMARAKDPRSWLWITELDQAGPEPAARKNIAPRLFFEESPPGEFQSGPGLPPQESGAAEHEQVTASSDTGQPDVDLFEGVRDKTGVIPPRAYFQLLDRARRTSDSELERQADAAVTFAQLATQPDQYRGNPIFLKGHLRRMTQITPRANTQGFDRLYEGWLFTDESLDNPYVIIVSHIPDGLPIGGSIVEDVSFAGYFLKLWAYRAGDGDRYAPLLLGRRVVWHPRPARFAPGLSLHAIIFGVVTALMLGLVAVTWYARRSSAALREHYYSRRDQPSPSEIRSIGESAVPDTEQFLEKMERESRDDS